MCGEQKGIGKYSKLSKLCSQFIVTSEKTTMNERSKFETQRSFFDDKLGMCVLTCLVSFNAIVTSHCLD